MKSRGPRQFLARSYRPECGRHTRRLLAVGAVVLDERLGGGILGSQGLVVVEGRRNLLGKLLAQLNAPLIVGVKAPDGTLNKGDVLVERDELAQGVRSQLGAKDRGGGTVALNTRAGTIHSAVPSARTSSAVLPKARALV